MFYRTDNITKNDMNLVVFYIKINTGKMYIKNGHSHCVIRPVYVVVS